MKNQTVKIVVNLDVRHQASREVIAGVLRFVAIHPEWDLQMRGNHPSNDGFLLDSKWMPDGLIIDGTWKTEKGGKLLCGKSLRGAVFVSTLPPKHFLKAHETVTTDDRDLALAAAKLFLGHGLKHFAFIGTRDDERRQLSQEPLQKTLRDDDERVPICNG